MRTAAWSVAANASAIPFVDFNPTWSAKSPAARRRGISSLIELINELMPRLRAAGDLALQVGLKSTKGIADAFAATDQAAVLIGRDGSVIYVNARFEQLLG